MKKDWIGNVFFATLASIVFYILQELFTNQHLSPGKAAALAIGLSGLGIGLCLRYVTTITPLRMGWFRRLLLPASALEGDWLETLERNDQIHDTIVELRYDPTSSADPFQMFGHSYITENDEHSEWETRYLKITHSGITKVEYIFEVTRSKLPGGAHYGYGEATYAGARAQSKPDRGHGYYFAPEEDPASRCFYELRRIDDDFRKEIGFDLKKKLDSHAAMKEFIGTVRAARQTREGSSAPPAS
jgi:hypothetical protein